MEFKLRPSSPYDFELSTKIFFSEKSIRIFENNVFKQLITINDKPVLIELKSTGTVDEPELELCLKSDKDIYGEESHIALETVKKIFNLDFNLEKFYDDVKSDDLVFKLTQKLRGLKNPATASIFEALVEAIVEQQISLKAAHSIERKIIKKYGSTLNVGSHVYYAFPTPEQLNNASFDELRGCGLTLRKTEYIKSISKEIENGNLDLEKFKKYEDTDKIINELCEIRGIGLWTAEFVMLRGLNRLESLPADDIGIKRIISHYYCNDRKISSEEVRKIAINWGKWKGLAAFYLIIAEMLNINI